METLIEKPYAIRDVENSIKPNSKNRPANESLKHDSMVEFLLIIRKNIRRIIAVGLIAFVAVFMYLSLSSKMYSSKVVFVVDDSDPLAVSTSETERLVLSQMNSLNKSRLFLLVFSDEMVKHLDRELKIGEHYKIKNDNASYENEIAEKLHEIITLKKSDYNAVYLEVQDEDKYYAPKIANTVYQYLVELNRATVLGNLRNKLNIYEKNISSFKEVNNNDINSMMQALNNWPDFGKGSPKNSESMLYLRRDLMNTFLNYANSAKELKNNELIYSLTSNVMKDTCLQSLYLISKACPDANSNNYLRTGSISLGLAFCTMLYYVFSIYLYQKHKFYFHVLYKKTLPEIYH